MNAPKKYSANVWAVCISSLSVWYKKRINEVEKPRMTKTIVAINLFLFIYRVYYNKTITNSATIYLKVK